MQTNRISSPWTRAAGAALLACCSWVMAAPGGETPPPNPYPVERSWPEYFLEHQKLFTEQAGTYRAGDYPVWTIHAPDGWIGNSTVIEGDDHRPTVLGEDAVEPAGGHLGVPLMI